MKDQQEPAINRLKKAVISQKTHEFPGKDVPDEEVQAARVRLENYDRLVSSLVIQAMQGGWIDIYPDQKDPDLNIELSALYQNKPEPLKPIVAAYRRYKEQLDSMLDLAIQVSKERQER